MTADLNVITPGIPAMDGCPVLTRIKAFICQEGVNVTLEQTFRDRTGNPVDLFTPAEVSESGSIDFSDSDNDDSLNTQVILRIAEFSGFNQGPQNIKVSEGSVIDATNGVVRAPIPSSIYGQSGIYRLSWALVREGDIVLINDGLLSVERSLFGFNTPGYTHTDGPPTINELRMSIVDSSPVENQYLLDDLEFSDEQLTIALTKPLADFNDMPPRIRLRFDSRNFPWKQEWLSAASGYLYQMAAAHYRRNKANLQGGGQLVGDKDKEREYLAAYQMHKQQWDEFRQLKKLQISMHECAGSYGSDYGSV